VDQVGCPEDPRRFDLRMVASELGFRSQSDFARALGAINTRGYDHFALEDDRGRRRVISAPHEWLKSVQRQAYDSILVGLPASDHVYSSAGRGVIQNAEQHIDHAYLTVMDVADCFPSTSVKMIRQALLNVGLSSDVAGGLTRLTSHHGFLPQGPPTSPAVLDLVFRPIDDSLSTLAAKYGSVYTRYMDDLAFSGAAPQTGLIQKVGRVLRHSGYRSNPLKTRAWGPGNQHTVTNIVVTTTLNPTPEFLKALTHHLTQLVIGSCRLTEQQLRGKIRWVTTLNPQLGRTLENRLRRYLHASARAPRVA
jgi:RNA-directed DNA polymerase